MSAALKGQALTPAQRRALALLERLKEFNPPDWHRHWADLKGCERMLRRLKLPAGAEQARELARAAFAHKQAQRPFQVGREAKRYCSACGARLLTRWRPRADHRFCAPRCRIRFFRGEWMSQIEAEAQAIGLGLGDLWRTPPRLLEQLREEFGAIALDAAATAHDSVAPAWIEPGQDALSVAWLDFLPAAGWIWVNPPYSRLGGGLEAWLKRAHEQAQALNRVVIVLAPPGIGTAYRAFAEEHAAEIRDLRRRLAFLHPETGRPQKGNRDGSSLFIFSPSGGPARVVGWDYRRGAE